MTWTKLGDEFTAECGNCDLSDAAFRTHVELIAWLYRVEQMSLRIPKPRVPKVLESNHAETAMRELLALGWYRSHDTEYELLHHADVIRQSLAAQQAKRVRDKKAQQSFRDKQKVSADVSADVIPDTDRQTSSYEGGDLKACEHGTSWGCLKCKQKERDSA